MSIQFSQQGMAALPASFARPRSSFVRRLLRAGDKFVGAARGRCSAYAGDAGRLKLSARARPLGAFFRIDELAAEVLAKLHGVPARN